MVLYRKQYGRAGGCHYTGGVAQLGEHLPCKQGVKSSNLSISIAKRLNESFMAYMYLENCIPNEKLYKYFIIRHPRILIERLIFLNNKNKFLNIVYDTR